MKTQFTKMCSVMLFALLSILCANAQTLNTVYQTSITTANGWTTNTSTGTSTSVNYSQNNCVFGGGGSITINTAQTRCTTYSGEVGMAGSNRWMDLPLIAFGNNAGGTSAGTLSVTWYNNGGGRTVSYYLTNAAGTATASAGSVVATSTAGTNGNCTTYDFTLPAITGSKSIKLLVNGNSGMLAVTVKTYQSCTAPTISTDPSPSNVSYCNGATPTALTVAVSSGTPSYQWYSNSSAGYSGGTLISGATNASYSPLTTTNGTLYYYCIASNGTGCNDTSNVSGSVTVNAAPTPTFTASPSATTTQNTSVTYTTQSGQSNYVWSVPGVLNTDYSISSGGLLATDNTVTLTWLTTGSKTVTVNYSSNGCTGASAASSNTVVTSAASTFYNKTSTDITQLSNWGTNTDGTGTAPSDFTTDGQTFNLFNSGATVSTDWTVSGASSKIILGNGTNPVSFNASTIVSATIDVANNATLVLSNSAIPTFGTLATGSTIEYAGSSITQSVTSTTYSNLILSGSGSRTFSGTTNISGTFSPGTGFSAAAGTIVLNGTSSSQSIPAFAYNSLSVIGVDGKSTTGSISVFGTLTMSNSFTVSSGHTLTMGSAATMSSTASKVLTVNGTFELQQSSVTFNAGSGSVIIAAGGVLKMTGTLPNNALAFTNVNFTSGVGAAGSTLYLATLGCPRLPATTFNGNVTYDLQTSIGVVNILNTSPITITGNMNVLGTGGVILTQASGGTARSLTVQGSLNMSGAARYDISANGSTGACSLTVNGNLNITGSNDTLYTNNAAVSGGTGTINILGNLSHSAGVLGRSSASAAIGTIAFTGSTSQDVSSIGITSNTNVTLNNSNGVRLLTDLSVGSTLTLTSGKLRTNGNSVILTGSTSTIASASTTGYIATCDASGTPSTTGGLTIQNIGTGGRTTAVSFPIGTNTSYNPATVTNSSASVAYTARVNTTAFAGTTSDSTVARTWNIQPASGTPSTVIGLQWNAAEQGANFNNSSAAIAHYNTGTSSVDDYSDGGVASGTDPYTLNSGAKMFTSFGDFGLIPGVIIPAAEPTLQATSVSITPSNTSMNISWTVGNGTNSIVIVKRDTAVTTGPVDGATYTANTIMGSGSQIGTLNYVVYNGVGNSATVTGLTSGTNYFVSVYTFNGNNGTQNYLTTSPATASTTTTIPTYYYVGGAGSSSNTFATANMWANSLGGTPLAAFTPGNNDVFVFDASNLGGGYTDSVTIAPAGSSSVLGKVSLINNARVNIVAGSSSNITIGNSSYSSNTNVLNVSAGSKLYISGSATTITLASNSSANVSGSFYLGNGSANCQLIPGASGSFVTVNNGAYFETNLSSSSTNPFGTSGTNLVNFLNGSIYKHSKASDVFGGAANSVVSFASGSTFWYANTSNSSAQTLSGRTFGNVIVEANWSPTVGTAGFTFYNFTMPTTGFTLTILETGTNCHLKGNVSIAAGATLKFNPANPTLATLNFSGTSAQTITNNGTWSINSTNVSTGNNQNFVISNTAGVSFAGTGTTGIAGLAGTSLTVNSGCSLNMTSGSLNLQGGTLNLIGTISRTSGNIIGVTANSTVNITGASSLPANIFRSDSIRNFILNNGAGVTLGGDIKVVTALTLTNGTVNTGSNNMILLTGATVSRGNGWVNGNLRKNVATGSNVARTYEIGDASNYTPVAVTFASVTTAGDLVMKSVGSISSQANIATAPVSTTAYVNRYWSLTNATTLAFTNYKATFNYVNTDFVGGASSSSVVAAKYSSGWSKSTPISVGATADSINAITTLGDIIFANDCVTVTPTISISSTSTTFCTGSSATFTADITNGGSAPSYQWKRNSNNIGTNSSTLTLFATDVANGDVITCVLTSNNVCQTTATTTSDGLTLAVGGTVTPSLIIVTASDTVCSGNTTTFTALATDGGSSPVFAWKKNFVDVGSGSSIDFLGGTLTSGDIISCVLTANNICQTTATANSNYVFLTVKTSPVVMQTQSQSGATITSASICTLGSTGTTRYGNLTPYGVWSSSNPAIASVTYNGFVTGNSNGTATISYTVAASNGCTVASNVLVTVAQQATPSATTGNNSICIGTTTALSNNTTTPVGGSAAWSSSNNRGTISNIGVYTGANAGAGEARYTVTNAASCSAYVNYPITVNPTPAVPTIAYAPGTVLTGPTSPFYGAPTGSYCVGKQFTVVGSSNIAGSGVWSATGAASITSGGVVTINAVGAGTVKYTYTSNAGCVNSRTLSATGYTCASRGAISNEQLAISNIDFTMYPNPARSVISLQVDKLIGAGSIVVTDLYGKSVKTQLLSMGTNTVDIAKLSKGMYFVSVITSEGKTTKKLVVE